MEDAASMTDGSVRTEDSPEVARRLADKDVSAAEISRLLGVSRNTVYRYLKRENGLRS